MIQHTPILRFPDASGAQEQDPLAGAASGWAAPQFPVLMADRLVDVEIMESTKGLVKDDKGKAEGRESLTIKFKTVKEYPDKDGKPLKAGFTGFHRISITPSTGDPTKRDRTWQNIGEDLALILKCCGEPVASRSPRDLLNDPSMLVKQIITMKTRVNPPQGGFPESNGFTPIPPEKKK